MRTCTKYSRTPPPNLSCPFSGSLATLILFCIRGRLNTLDWCGVHWSAACGSKDSIPHLPSNYVMQTFTEVYRCTAWPLIKWIIVVEWVSLYTESAGRGPVYFAAVGMLPGCIVIVG